MFNITTTPAQPTPSWSPINTRTTNPLTQQPTCQLEDPVAKFEAFLFVAISLITLCGSIVVVVCFIRHRSLRNSTNVFIVSLTASDLFVAVLSIPYSFGVFMCGWRPDSHDTGSVVYLICDMLPSILSIYSLCLVALDRALAVTNPFFHTRYVHVKSASVAVVSVWMFVASFVAFIYILGRRQFTLFIIFMSYVIPVSVMVTCYALIGYVGRQHNNAVALMEKSNLPLAEVNKDEQSREDATNNEDSMHLENEPTQEFETTYETEIRPPLPSSAVRSNKKRRLTVRGEQRGTLTWMRKAFCRKMSQVVSVPEKRSSLNLIRKEFRAAVHLLLLLGVFVIAWTPFIGLNIRMYVCEGCHIDSQLVKYFKFLHYSNSAINPLLYVVLNKRWRKAISAVFFWTRQHGRTTDETLSQLDGW